MAIERFDLPRKDWHDTAGRIYKDRLIENFNALEAKFNELTKLDAFRKEPPDFNTIELENVTLDSPNDNVVNLGSFLRITHANYYPVDCYFEGTTCKKLALWTYPDYNYVVKHDIKLDANDTNRYVYANWTTGDLTVQADTTAPADSRLVGVFTNGKIIGLYSNSYMNVNILDMLAKLKPSISTHNSGGEGERTLYGRNGRGVAWVARESKAGWHDMTVRDLGVE